jgi:hypothetical protein
MRPRNSLYRFLIPLILCSSCASLFVDGKAPENINDLKYTIVLKYAKSYPDQDPNVFYRFHENLKAFYLDFAQKEHLTFSVDGDKIIDRSVIRNTEESGGQYLEHRYTVHIDKDAGLVEWISPNTLVRITKWNLEMHVATILRFHVSRQQISEELVIAFGSQRDLNAAMGEHTDAIWKRHNAREMENAFMIADYLASSRQLANDPSTWNIDPIRAKLK